MAKAKAKRARSVELGGGRQGEVVALENAYGNGGVDRVVVVDTVAALAARGRLDVDQIEAARRYRAAFDGVMAALGNRVDVDRVDRSGHDGVSDRQLRAARDLAEAHRVLGHFAWVVKAVVGEGASLRDVAGRLGETCPRVASGAASVLLRTSLTALAVHWMPQRKARIGSVHSADYRPSLTGGDSDAALPAASVPSREP